MYPNFEVYVSAETIINPSEEPSRVIKCLINTINGGSPEINEEGNLAMVKTEGLHALHHIRVGVKARFSAGVLRRLFEYNRSNNKTWFLLNKQAAYSGVIAIVESSVESSLGPIMVTITSRDLDRVLEWLVPINEKKIRNYYTENHVKE
ncbi:MAG: RNA-binding domain-containing protein [Nitrososphaeraceae archaeon]